MVRCDTIWFGIGIIVVEKRGVSVIIIKHYSECGEMVWIRGRVDQSSTSSPAPICTSFSMLVVPSYPEHRGSRYLQNVGMYQTTWCHIPEDSS
jgi:hypothetical protein